MLKRGTVRKLPKLSTNRHISRFLLVSLNIDAILQETTARRRRQKLDAITDGLGLESAYEKSFGRMKGQGGGKTRLGTVALMWITHSERPLKVVELCHALAVEIGSPNFNGDDAPSIETLLSCCQGLVVVDKESSTVRLIHFTFQQYLRAHGEFFGHNSLDDGRDLLDLFKFAASQDSFGRPLSRSPRHTFSRIFFLVLGSACKKGPFRSREIACIESI